MCVFDVCCVYRAAVCCCLLFAVYLLVRDVCCVLFDSCRVLFVCVFFLLLMCAVCFVLFAVFCCALRVVC